VIEGEGMDVPGLKYEKNGVTTWGDWNTILR